MAMNGFYDQFSIQELLKVTCHSCELESEQQVWTIINASTNSKLVEQIIDGTIFDITCPHCGNSASFLHSLLYLDPKHRACVFLAADMAMAEIITHKFLKDEEQASSGKDPITKRRIVYTINDLRSRALALSNGLDDRIIELMMADLIRECVINGSIAEDDEVNDIAFTGIDDLTLEFSIYCDSKILTATLKRSLYNKFETALMKSPEADSQPYDADITWAMETLKMLYEAEDQ